MKYISSGDGAGELYDLDADPLEHEDLSQSDHGISQSLFRSLQEWQEGLHTVAVGPSAPIAPATRKALEALGYTE